jgi:putative ABC transport system substrate-binding protein
MVGHVGNCHPNLGAASSLARPALTAANPDVMMPPREGPPMERRGSRLSRRAFVVGAGVGGLAVVSGCAPSPAQPPAKAVRIGFIGVAPQPPHKAFPQALDTLGYVEGQNLTIEWRYADGRMQDLPNLAADLVGLGVQVIVAAGSATPAAREATTTIPIVMVAGSPDPVADGWVASYARPGGNLTGLTTQPGYQFGGKRLELLHAAVPEASRVAVLIESGASPYMRKTLEDAARAFDLQVLFLEVRDPDDIAPAIQTATVAQAQALFVVEQPMLTANQAQIADLALKERLPAMAIFRQFATAGLLMAYGPDLSDVFRRAAGYVDRILKGANPADLPIEQPMRFDFVVNMKTAQALGITFPNEIMLQVTEVIQ